MIALIAVIVVCSIGIFLYFSRSSAKKSKVNAPVEERKENGQEKKPKKSKGMSMK